MPELASGRIYLEIVGGDGKAEIRGQLEPNGAMVPVKNFVARLGPAPGTKGTGAGTAALSEVHFPDGRVSVFYRVTVAGTSSAPTEAALVSSPVVGAVQSLQLLKQSPLPKAKLVLSKASARGGSMAGQYQTTSKKKGAVFATELLATGSKEIGIAVKTSKFPNGELYGVFRQVN